MAILKIQQLLAQKKLKIFSISEFKRITGLSKIASQRLLERYTKRNFFARLKKGLYCFSFNQTSEWEIANRLVRPSYISYETALSYYGIIPESVYAITSATTKKTKEFEIGRLSFVYHHITKLAFTGYMPMKKNDNIILIAQKEKALCDYLFLRFIRGERIPDRLNLSGISKRKLLRFSRMFRLKGFINWIKNVVIRNN